MINSLFRRFIKFLISIVHLLFSRSSNLFQLFHHGDSSKSVQGFTLCFQPLFFPSVWSCFYYRSSSWRFYMMVHQGFNSFSECSSRFFSEKLKYSSSCIPKCSSSYIIFWGCVMSFLTISLCFMIHMLSRMRYLIPSFFLRWC